MGKANFTTIDLFAGAGGLTLGFEMAGFEPVIAAEYEPDFAKTYRLNFGVDVLEGDIRERLKEGRFDSVRADVVLGGPPCQGFSNLTGNKADDPRRSLWRAYADVLERSEAVVFVCENVPNMLDSDEGEALKAAAKKLKFHVTDQSCGFLMASHFGVPQRRKRAIIMGSKLGPISLPAPTGPTRTVREAFQGIDEHDAPIPLEPTTMEFEKGKALGPDLHIGRRPTAKSMERYRCIPKGGNRFDLPEHLKPGCWQRKTKGGTDLFGRLEYDKPAHCTIRTEFYKPEKGRYLHPKAHRPITHWEAARLQSFPDSFRWFGSKIRIAIQIGNAVPPLLGKALADTVRAHLEEHGHKPIGLRRKRMAEAAQEA